jgi:radical SAM superfamily enzyme YgiQ (UPF0313 family)
MRKPRTPQNFSEYSMVRGYIQKEYVYDKNRGNAQIEVALIFPSGYENLVGNLGFHKAFQIINGIDNINCERFFYDESFAKFYSLDSLRPIDEFSIWAFSLHYELDYLHVFDILKKKGIPFCNKDRTQAHPLLLFGGSLTYFNSNPLWSVADIIFHGDAEIILKETLEALKLRINEGKHREALLESLCDYPCLSIPTANKENTSVHQFHNLGEFPSHSSFVYPEGPFGYKNLIEIGRGCYRRCAFCITGHTRHPARFLPINVLKDEIAFFLSKMSDVPLEKKPGFGFISATPTDYPFLQELLAFLDERSLTYSFSSLRLESLSKELLKGLRRGDQYSITIAPEGATEKIRNILNKNISDTQLHDALIRIFEEGFREIKCYCLFGIAEETEEDLRAFSDIAEFCKSLGFYKISMSFNPLIPKPLTPFRNREFEHPSILRKKKHLLERSLHGKCNLSFESIRLSGLQYLLAHATKAASKSLLRLENTEITPQQVLKLLDDQSEL